MVVVLVLLCLLWTVNINLNLFFISQQHFFSNSSLTPSIFRILLNLLFSFFTFLFCAIFSFTKMFVSVVSSLFTPPSKIQCMAVSRIWYDNRKQINEIQKKVNKVKSRAYYTYSKREHIKHYQVILHCASFQTIFYY